MARRSTIHDIAKEAGLSVATVDRVLNGRQKVREETALRVSQAATKVGYHAARLIEQRLQPELPELTFGVILQKEGQEFYMAVRSAFEDAIKEHPGIRGRLIFEFCRSQSPTEFATLLNSMHGRVDGVAATTVSHHEVTSAVTALREKNVPVIALLNDFAQGVRQSYVGLNNMQVGRVAGWMAATAAKGPGKMALFIGGHRWHGHELRETGYRSYFREYAPQFQLLDTMVNLETRQLTYEATLDLLSRHSDIAGIYVAGGGMEGAISALREMREPGEVALIVNELTPDSRRGLADKYIAMTISTPLRQISKQSIQLMVDAHLNGISEVTGQVFLQPVLAIPESV